MFSSPRQQYSLLLKAFTSQGLSEISLLLKIQEYCYDNINFMNSFQKIVLLLYKSASPPPPAPAPRLGLTVFSPQPMF